MRYFLLIFLLTGCAESYGPEATPLPASATNQYAVSQYCASHGGSACLRDLVQQSDPRVAHVTW